MKNYFIFALILICSSCISQYKNVQKNIYTSPNGGFLYTIKNMESLGISVHEFIGSTGGNVQFHYGSYFKRIDYEELAPELEIVTKDHSLRVAFLTKFTKEIMIPRISSFVKSTEVKFEAIENIDNIPVFYTSLYMPGASIAFANGSACRSMFTHTDGKRVFVYTVSMDFEEIGPLGEKFKEIEKKAKIKLQNFFKNVSLK